MDIHKVVNVTNRNWILPHSAFESHRAFVQRNMLSRHISKSEISLTHF